jgi:hypothetical protein
MARLWIRAIVLLFGCLVVDAIGRRDAFAEEAYFRTTLHSATAEFAPTHTTVTIEGHEIAIGSEDENPIVKISLFHGRKLLKEVPPPEHDDSREPTVCEPEPCSAGICPVRFDSYYEAVNKENRDPLVLKVTYKDDRTDPIRVRIPESP